MKELSLLIFLSAALAAQSPTLAQRNDACYAMRGQRTAEAIAAMRQGIDDPEIRACAARNLRTAEAVDALVDALGADSPDTRIAAARELGALGNARALDSLGRAALDPNPLVASSAVAALGSYPARAALPLLLQAASQPTVAGVTALEQAARWRDPAVLPIAREVVVHGDAASQVIALGILGELGTASDLEPLREMAARAESVSSRGRGFGFMPAIDLGRVARNAMEKIEARQ